MTNQYFEKIVNAETGEETIRPFTEQEVAKMKAAEAEAEAKATADQAKETQKAALLEKLGITQEEAKLLLS
jgi:hypothetical protein